MEASVESEVKITYDERYSPEWVSQENYASFIREVAKSITDGVLPDGRFGVLETEDDNKSGTWISGKTITFKNPYYSEERNGDTPFKPEYELSPEKFACAVAWVAAGRLSNYLRAVNKSVYGKERRNFGGFGQGDRMGCPIVAADAREAGSVSKVLHERWNRDDAVWMAKEKGEKGDHPSDFFTHRED